MTKKNFNSQKPKKGVKEYIQNSKFRDVNICTNKIEPPKTKPDYKHINKIEQHTLKPDYTPKNKISPPKLQPNYKTRNKIEQPQLKPDIDKVEEKSYVKNKPKNIVKLS